MSLSIEVDAGHLLAAHHHPHGHGNDADKLAPGGRQGKLKRGPCGTDNGKGALRAGHRRAPPVIVGHGPQHPGVAVEEFVRRHRYGPTVGAVSVAP